MIIFKTKKIENIGIVIFKIDIYNFFPLLNEIKIISILNHLILILEILYKEY